MSSPVSNNDNEHEDNHEDNNETEEQRIEKLPRWGETDKAIFRQLVVDGKIDIDKVDSKYIECIRQAYFRRRGARSFATNYRWLHESPLHRGLN